MSTNVKTGNMLFPFPLGKLLPGADFATLSVPLTENFTPCNSDGVTPDNQFNAITVQAGLDNTGVIYICNSAAAPDKTGYTNVIQMLTKGQTWGNDKGLACNRGVNSVFIGADNGTDFAIANIDQL